ncbi:Adenylate cyclase [Diplonema papillatum]|nr:Adenylate cyclase [Diplonema papillatum]
MSSAHGWSLEPRKILLHVSGFSAALAGVSSGFLYLDAEMTLGHLMLGVAVIHFSYSMLFLKVHHVTTWMIDSFLAYLLLMIFIFDRLSGARNTPRTWPMALLLVDLQLIFSADKKSVWLVVLIVGWMFLTGIEDSVRFGLYDLFANDEQYEHMRETCDCEHPPCAKSLVTFLPGFVPSFFVVVLDFMVTRRFATKSREANAKLAASSTATEAIAHALAAFDLETASAILEQSRDIPPSLSSALETILENLNKYKPYLPEALLVDPRDYRDHANPDNNDVPGLETGHAAIVFTDIKSSTLIWNACPEGMKKGLQLHNKVIRELIREFGGYEVKTIGDAFMIAFRTAADATLFGMAAQVRLLHAPWPASLLALPQCARDGDLWAGLRIRVGVHCGDVTVEKNEVLNRYDYFGTTVNKAARVEAVSAAGAVGLTEDVEMAVGGLEAVQGLSVISRGMVNLQGLGLSLIILTVPSEVLQRQHTCRMNDRRKSEARESVVTVSSLSNGPDVMKRVVRRVSSASVAGIECRYETPDEAQIPGCHEAALDIISSVLQRTNGTILAVMDCTIFIGWNTVYPCSSHLESAIGFTQLLDAESLGVAGCFRMGITTGTFFVGSVVISDRQFMNIFGSTIPLIPILVQAAESFSTAAMFASLSSTQDLKNNYHSVIRPVLEARAPLQLRLPSSFTIYQIRSGTLASGPFAQPGEEEWAWSPAYWTAYEACNADELHRHADGDKAVTRAAVSLNLKNTC